MRMRAAVVVTTLLVAATAALCAAAPVQASAYRYWTYWKGIEGTWAFASAGPAFTVPPDGSVDGWRFAVTTASGSAEDAPSTPPSFDSVCGATAPVADRKRVALIVDSGPSGIAPDGQVPPALLAVCVVADNEATGYEVLRSVATVRTENGLVCAIAGFPREECASVVPDAVASPAAAITSPSPADGVSSALTAPPAEESGGGAPWVTAAVLALLAVVGAILWRRRRA